jgi:hypothetical protein
MPEEALPARPFGIRRGHLISLGSGLRFRLRDELRCCLRTMLGFGSRMRLDHKFCLDGSIPCRGLVTLRGLAEMGSATCPSLCHSTRSFAPRGERLGSEEPVRAGGGEVMGNGKRVVDSGVL